jgi:hypothetical protein
MIEPVEELPDSNSPGGERRLLVRRRTMLKGLAALGVGTTTFRRALAAQAAQAGAVTPAMIKQAEWIAGLDLTEEECTSAARTITRSLRSFAELRKVDVGYDVPPALTFFPAPPRPAGVIKRNQARNAESTTSERPGSAEELAFLPLTELSSLIRSRQVSSMELTKLYLDRLKRFDPLLKCVVTFTEDVEEPRNRRQGHRGGSPGRGRGRADRQAIFGRTGDGRPVVWRPDP